MDIVVLSSSPNSDGLTAACASAAAEGARVGGAAVEEICLNDLPIGMCEACNDGWGTCRDENECQIIDGFQPLHRRIREADGYILVTPVYWGDLSESAKRFTDRLRRCEARLGDESALADKPVLAVATAGGSGGGMITCLLNMERWIQHVRARTWDLIPVNRWSREYKLDAIREAAHTMVVQNQG